MKLTILGGGGFRVPLVYSALLGDRHEQRVDEVALHDVDADRLAVIGHVLEQRREPGAPQVAVTATTDLARALDGADFVFSAMRVGGAHGRTCDERVALDLGVLGQETTGPGGIAYGLRTVPVAVRVAEAVAAHAPQAWVVNFTNPAGMITEAMQSVLGDRVVGICDSPIGLGRRAARALGLDPEGTTLDYVGLNHLGWLRGLRHHGRDVLPQLLADDALLAGTEEGALFGADWLRSIAAVPNEYLYYYYFTREALTSIRGSAQTRGEFLLDQQAAFYAGVAADPDSALAAWRRTRAQRDATYMMEARAADEARDVADLESGGYEQVALALMGTLARGGRETMLLNVRNGSAVPGLPAGAVVEVPCVVEAGGITPLATRPLEGHMLGLVQQVKNVETLTIEAALERDARRAVEAFALHPLVDSVGTARALFTGYRARIPELATVFDGA